MILGIVKGTVVATRKMPELVGYKFLLVEPVFGSKKDTIVAVSYTHLTLPTIRLV